MTPERWRQIEDLYQNLVDLNPDEWDPALLRIEDPTLREEVRKMLHAAPLALEEEGGIGSFASAASNAVHQIFGPWRATRLIGFGGMGAVYEGVRDDDAYVQKAAIKVLQTGRDAPAERERFRLEREILATLNHPYIAHLIDGGETPAGVSYIVMEFVDGLPVTEWCADRKPARDEILRLFLKICAGVDYAHQRLVVHRDLKPANILVTADGMPKLLDFGIAKLLDQPKNTTQTGYIALTPAYASPEQILRQPVTTASDVYSLGVILYQLLTGRTPYDIPSNSSPPAITEAICETPAAPPGITGDIDNILLMALRKEPERRYPSVAAFAADIENFLAHRVVVAREDTLWYRASRFARRNAVGLSAVITVVLTLAGGIVVSQQQARLAQRRFEDVKGLANDLLFGVDARLSEIPATGEARQLLLRTVLRHLQQLARDARGDRGLEAELAAAYQRAGSLQSVLANTGDPKDSLLRAVELGERVRSSGAADASLLKVLAQSYHLLGIRAYELGEYAPARQYFLTAIERAKDPRLQNGGQPFVAVTSRWIGRMENESGQVSQAIVWMEQAVKAAADAVAMEPNPTNVMELVSARTYLARSLKLGGELARAMEIAAVAAKEAESLYSEHPRNSTAKLGVVIAYTGAGAEHALPAGMPRYIVPAGVTDKAVALARSMSEQEPETNYLRTWLLTAYLQQSHAAANASDAVEAARNALAVAEKQIAETPHSTIYLRNRALVRIQLADALRRSGDRAQAVEQATLARQELSAKFTDRESKAATLAATLVLASVDLDNGDKASAISHFNTAKSIAEALVALDRTDMRMAAFLALTYEGLAQCSTGFDSEQWFARSAELWKRWPNAELSPAGYAQEHLRSIQAAAPPRIR